MLKYLLQHIVLCKCRTFNKHFEKIIITVLIYQLISPRKTVIQTQILVFILKLHLFYYFQ